MKFAAISEYSPDRDKFKALTQHTAIICVVSLRMASYARLVRLLTMRERYGYWTLSLQKRWRRLSRPTHTSRQGSLWAGKSVHTHTGRRKRRREHGDRENS